MSRKNKFIERRGNLCGRIHENGVRIEKKLCTLEEYYFKYTVKGKKKRTEIELENFREKLFQEWIDSRLEEVSCTIKSIGSQWIEWTKSNRSQSTADRYNTCLKHLTDALSDIELSSIQQKDSIKLVEHLKRLNLSESTIRSTILMCNGLFQFAHNNGMIERKLSFKLPRITQKNARVYTKDELIKIYNLIINSIHKFPHRKHEYQNHLRLFMMLTHTGMRLSEIRTLQIKHIDLYNKRIYIKDVPEANFRVKSRREQSVPINNGLHSFLEEDLKRDDLFYIASKDGGIAYKDSRSISRIFMRLQVKAGIKDVKSVHGFRATIATELLKAGVDVTKVQKILRHQDIKTTMRYINTDEIDIEEALNQIQITQNRDDTVTD